MKPGSPASFCAVNSPRAIANEAAHAYTIRASSKLTCSMWTFTQRNLRLLPVTDWDGVHTRRLQPASPSRYAVTNASKKKREEAEAAPVLTADFPCPRCPRVCASQMGLYSHLRPHAKKDSCWLHIIVIVGFDRLPREDYYHSLTTNLGICELKPNLPLVVINIFCFFCAYANRNIIYSVPPFLCSYLFT